MFLPLCLILGTGWCEAETQRDQCKEGDSVCWNKLVMFAVQAIQTSGRQALGSVYTETFNNTQTPVLLAKSLLPKQGSITCYKYWGKLPCWPVPASSRLKPQSSCLLALSHPCKRILWCSCSVSIPASTTRLTGCHFIPLRAVMW